MTHEESLTSRALLLLAKAVIEHAPVDGFGDHGGNARRGDRAQARASTRRARGLAGPVRTLDHDQAAAFYDRFGRRQDWQGWYEGPAVRTMLAQAAFGEARSVFELGCGTGALARRLLSEQLPVDARYVGVDVSNTMVAIARERIGPWSGRAEVRPSDGSLRFPELADASFDRFVSCYVLDLLSEEDIRAALVTASRLLSPTGRLALVSLTNGTGPLSRALCRAWTVVHERNPAWVGGCRPIRLTDYLDDGGWKLLHRVVVTPFGVPSEVIVATNVAQT